MKKLITFFCLALATGGFSQNSIQPSFGFNIWNVKLGGFGSSTSTFFELGADYEHGLTDQFGINGGASYNFGSDLSNGGGFFKINAGGRYNLNELNDGLFLGGDLGLGFRENSNVMTFGANIGYSIPVGNGSLNPNVSIGYMSSGSNGFRIGGFYLPINISYSINL